MKGIKAVLFAVAIFIAGGAITVNAEMMDRETLEKYIGIINTGCPVSMGSLGTLELVYVKGNSVIMEYDIDFSIQMEESGEPYGMSDKNRKEFVDNVVENMKGMVHSSTMFSDFMQNIHSSGMSLQLIYKINDKKAYEVVMTNDMISDALSGTPDYKKMVANNLQDTSRFLPLTMGPFTVTEIFLEGNDVISLCNVDETEVNMDQLSDNKSVIKESILNLLRAGTDINFIVDTYKTAKGGYNTVYRYTGPDSGKSFQITITPAEVFDILGEDDLKF